MRDKHKSTSINETTSLLPIASSSSEAATSAAASNPATDLPIEVVVYDSTQKPQSTPQDFVELLRYVVTTKQPLGNPLWSFAMLTPVALASMWMYIRPSWKAGMDEGGLPMAVLQLIGNTGSAGLVVYNIGGHYLGLIKASRDALLYLKTHNLITSREFTEAANYMEKISKILASKGRSFLKKLRTSKLDILAVSTIISFPLAAAALFYKDYDTEPKGLMLLKGAVTLAVNTLIHTLPVSLILNIPWLNTLLIKIPTAPFTFVSYLYRRCIWTKNKRIQYQLEQQLRLEQKSLRLHMLNKIYALVAQMQNNGFSRQGCSYTVKLPPNVQDLLVNVMEKRNISEQDMPTLLALLPIIAEFYAKPSTATTTQSQHTTIYQYLGYLNTGLRSLAGMAGALLIGGSVAGYAKVNYDLYNKEIGSQAVSIALITPTVAAMEVLCGYFGWAAFSGAYDFIANLVTCRPQTPYVFKLNPILSGFFLATTWTIGYFGYGTALQLVHDTFDPKIYGKILCDLLAISAKYGIIVYGFINFAQLVEKLVEPIVKFKFSGSSAATQQYLFMLNSLRRMAALIDELTPTTLQEILNTITDPKILETFDLEITTRDERSYTATVTTEQLVRPIPPTTQTNSPSQQQSWSSWLGSFFSRDHARSEDKIVETQPLLVGANLGNM